MRRAPHMAVGGMKKRETKVTLKYATPDPLLPVHRGPEIKISPKKIVLFTTGTSRRVFAGFGVCSDDWNK